MGTWQYIWDITCMLKRLGYKNNHVMSTRIEITWLYIYFFVIFYLSTVYGVRQLCFSLCGPLTIWRPVASNPTGYIKNPFHIFTYLRKLSLNVTIARTWLGLYFFSILRHVGTVSKKVQYYYRKWQHPGEYLQMAIL